MKTYIVDTNILLHSPVALMSFGPNKVVLPMTVIEEIDGHKTRSDDVGLAARSVARTLNKLSEQGPLSKGVSLDNGGLLQVMDPGKFSLCHDLSSTLLDLSKPDNCILVAAESLAAAGEEVIVATMDMVLKIKAEALGLKAEYHKAGATRVEINELYPGWSEMNISGERIDKFYQEKKLATRKEGLYTNEFVVLRDECGSGQSALARYNPALRSFFPLRHTKDEVWGLKPLNLEQRFAMELLMDEDIELVTMVGKAGTGKTLLALAAGLHQVVEESKYRKVLVMRPIMPMGKDIGYLPGDKGEKLRPWMAPIYDNLEVLMDTRSAAKKTTSRREGSIRPEPTDEVQTLVDMGFLELDAQTHMRGRSLSKLWLIIDEAQNLTPLQIKTIITRAGAGTKIILTGDPYQIDSPQLDSQSNGLVYTVERFKGQDNYGHITLTKGERSRLAEQAAELL